MYSEYFDEKELSCPCCGTLPINGLSDKLIGFLDNLQIECEEKINIESCYRCDKYNYQVNGYKNSYHMQGLAVNLIIPEGYSKKDFINLCDDMGAENIQDTEKDSVIHIDFA